MVGKLPSFPFGFRPIFRGELLVVGRVSYSSFCMIPPQVEVLAARNFKGVFLHQFGMVPWLKEDLLYKMMYKREDKFRQV